MSSSVARNALKGVLIGAEEIKINNEISVLIRDDNYFDFNRIEKYFKGEMWLECLKVYEQKFKIDVLYLSKIICEEDRFTCMVPFNPNLGGLFGGSF